MVWFDENFDEGFEDNYSGYDVETTSPGVGTTAPTMPGVPPVNDSDWWDDVSDVFGKLILPGIKAGKEIFGGSGSGYPNYPGGQTAPPPQTEAKTQAGFNLSGGAGLLVVGALIVLLVVKGR
jgi:hypothetical protein